VCDTAHMFEWLTKTLALKELKNVMQEYVPCIGVCKVYNVRPKNKKIPQLSLLMEKTDQIIMLLWWLMISSLTLLDEHENSNKENPRNRELGYIYTIEYANSESSSLFFYNPCRETVVYCQSRLRYCYKATLRRSKE
jgi:hypothetical protein